MIRSCLAFAAFALLAGCATPHLGPNFGQTSRAAFAAQSDRSGRPIAPLDAGDARLIMVMHRAKLRAFSGSASGGGQGGAGGAGAGGNITLQAK